MISLTSVSKNFDTVKVIKDISLTIKEGEIIGLLGPNGAGKTTTVRMIAGVLPPSSGTVTINDQDLFDPELSSRPHIGYLPENNPLFDDMTVEEFLRYWAELKHIAKENQSAEIRKTVKSTGLEAVYYRPITELSKGYRQRLGLAQAILSNPDILILDEPTEGLDPNQRNDIHKLLTDLGKKRTVIICSHVLSEITKICNRIIIINQGQIVADSPTSQLSSLASKAQIYELLAKGKSIKVELQKLDKVSKVEEQKDSMAVRYLVHSDSKKDLRLDIFKLAVKNKWNLYELVLRKTDLEDIFSQLTK